jgi:hypothetical protein
MTRWRSVPAAGDLGSAASMIGAHTQVVQNRLIWRA